MIESVRDFGETMSEKKLKDGLLKLQPALQFDPGARLDKWHPNIERWQGIYHNLRHVGSMSRGIIPEFNVWGVAKDRAGNKVKSHIHLIGWRWTMLALVDRGVPGITWDSLINVFKLDRKKIIPQNTPTEDLNERISISL